MIEAIGSQPHLSEARGRAIMENMASGLITACAKGIITSINSAARQAFGYDASEALGLHVLDLVHRSHRAKAAAVLEDLCSRTDDLLQESHDILCVRKDGTPFESEMLLSSVSVGGERIYIGNIRNISKRKETQRDVYAASVHYRATFDQALVGIAHADLTGRFIRANPKFCSMLGYSEKEMLARSYRDITHVDDQAQSRTRVEALLADVATPSALQDTKRYVRKDGTIVWALTSLSVIRRNDASPDYFLAMVQDITEIKRAEQIKDEFVSSVSHELRTPLTSIRGSLGLVAAGIAGPLPPAARELVLVASRNCERLVRLVTDILDTEKLESGTIQFRLGVADLRLLVQHAIEGIKGFALEHGVGVSLESSAEPVHANVDSDRFDQVLTNLLSNAVKFSPPGKPVEVTVSQSDGRARIMVRDHGPGVPAEFRSRIFQRFSQADGSDSRQIGGTGLGLYIAKGIMERLGGTIEFESIPGKGTTFLVQFPLAGDPALCVPEPTRVTHQV